MKSFDFPFNSVAISVKSGLILKGKDDFEEIRTLKHKMTSKFNVGDTVRYNSTNHFLSRFWSEDGVVFEVDTDHTTSRGTKEVCYSIRWADGSTNCMYFKDGLELVKSAANIEPTIKSAKELKAGLESEILRLIQDFNKKTNLQIKDIDLDRERMLGGDCFYRVNVKVEI